MINKAFRVTPSPKAAYSLAFGALLLLLFIVNPANSAFQCTQCPENFYCTGGQKLACPAEKPVTGKLGATECLECHQIDNAATPVNVDGTCMSCYDSSQGATHIWFGNECVTCAFNNVSTPAWNDNTSTPGCDSCVAVFGETKPYWDGTDCVGCGANQEWNETTKSCGCQDGYYEEQTGIPVYDLANNEIKYYLSADMIFNPSEKGLAVTKSQCEAMVAAVDENGNKLYPEVTGCYDFSANSAPKNLDYWAGAVKYCKDQGKRLPTMLELAYLGQTLYGDTSIGENTNNNSLTIANQALFDIAWSGRYLENDTYVLFWSSEQYSSLQSSTWTLNSSSFSYGSNRHNSHSSYNISAFCLDD